jgi:alpha-glucosidase (family GH31 glycosyl hydrolase)
MHNMFAIHQVKATHEWFQAKKQRTSIISRSSFAGQGKYGSRWLGDNFSDALNMGLSVPGTMMMNMFGIPVVGADVCGFIGDTTPELCARWTKLASFYPFARNHNDINSVDQEPYRPIFKEVYPDAQVVGLTFRDIIITSIKERYNLIPYLYSHVIKMNQEGGTYFKPVFFEFPSDPMAYADNTNNFMLGDSIKVSMVTDQVGVSEGTFYFPMGQWCPLWDMTQACLNMEKAGTVQLGATADVANVHMRPGSFVPTANAIDNKIMKVHDLKQFPTDLHVSPVLN